MIPLKVNRSESLKVKVRPDESCPNGTQAKIESWKIANYGQNKSAFLEGLVSHEYYLNATLFVSKNGSALDITPFSLPYDLLRLEINYTLVIPQSSRDLIKIANVSLEVTKSPIKVVVINGTNAKARFPKQV